MGYNGHFVEPWWWLFRHSGRQIFQEGILSPAAVMAGDDQPLAVFFEYQKFQPRKPLETKG